MSSCKLRNYDLPEGSIVVANLWKINRDPKYFDEPEKFMPERFIQEDGSFNDDLTKKLAAFSVGKRKCIGEKIARDELFLLITNLVRTFKVRLPLPAFYAFSPRSNKQNS
ncbi:p450 domain containing protein [Trichuris trichiura]|uniref:p450 domain containing protein n=1 Tax=Trichuris trichiura TaxID=36087 RepID=A0A077ZGA8_TRITR|nr:p450 domain containing protein [Trichuris trichiura]